MSTDDGGTARRPTRTRSTRAKVFRASMDLFGERGPDGVSVDEIAAAAGVSKGTVYYNFSSKSGLVTELLAFGVDLMEERLVVAADDDADPVRRAESMVVRALDFFDEYPSFTRLWMSEMWRTTTDSEWHAALMALRDRLLALVRGVLEEIAASRPVDPAVSADRLAVAVTGSTLFYGLHRQAMRPAADGSADASTEDGADASTEDGVEEITGGGADRTGRDEAIATLMLPITGWMRP